MGGKLARFLSSPWEIISYVLQCKFFLARTFMLMQCVIDPELLLSSCSFFSKSAIISIFFKLEPLHVGRFAVGERLLGSKSSVPVRFTNSVS